MDSSSPLAAMHRPSPVHSFSRGDIFAGMNSHYGRAGNSPLGMRGPLPKRFPKVDYFNNALVRGSSPAASLCADLSQNFRLDNEASPLFPTPRRALFPGLCAERREPMTTPPLLPSSPMPLDDRMDSTPVHSPMDEDDMMLDTPVPASRQTYLDPKQCVSDRRRPGLRRPSLSRTKGLVLGAAAFGRAITENAVPQFRLGSGEPKITHKSSAMSLGECFEAASPPPRERSGNSTPVPAQGHARRPSNPFLRSRKQVRRSLSMFEHPGDVMKSKPEADGSGTVAVAAAAASAAVATAAALQSVMDIVEDDLQPRLPHFFADDPADTIPRITKSTLLDVLDGKYNQKFDHRMIIDCRFEYEYEGGHIDAAISYNDKELLAGHLFNNPISGRALLVFHCEYSAHRAPLMARHIRSQDRSVNAEAYPRLTYPDIYILDGGYSAFFSEHRERCYPQNYIEMSDARHQRTCEREMGRLKARKGLGRAQTFAFGQRGGGGASSCVEDSPTAPGRLDSRLAPVDMIGNSPILGERSHARRMASY